MADDLWDLPFDDLRRRALDVAEQRHDRKFMWGMLKHTETGFDLAQEDGSLGHISGSIVELSALRRELEEFDPGELEPMFQAVLIDYLTKHPTPS